MGWIGNWLGLGIVAAAGEVVVVAVVVVVVVAVVELVVVVAAAVVVVAVAVHCDVAVGWSQVAASVLLCWAVVVVEAAALSSLVFFL